MALRRERHGPGHLPDDPLAELFTKNPDDDEKGVWNDAQSLIRLSEVFLANNRPEYALELAERGLALIESTPNPRATEYRRKPYAFALRAKSEAQDALGDEEGALETGQQARHVLASGSHEGLYEDGRDVDVLEYCARKLSDLEQLDEALLLEDEALGILRTLLDQNLGDHEVNLERLSSLLMTKTDTLAGLDRLEEASKCSGKSLETARELCAGNPDAYETNLVISLACHAQSLFRAFPDDRAPAIAIADEALQRWTELFRLRPDIYCAELSEQYYQNALYYVEMQDLDTACQLGEQAVKYRRGLFERQPGPHKVPLAQYLTNYAGDLLAADRPLEAATAGREALTLFRELHSSSNGPQGKDVDNSQHGSEYKEDLRMALENMVMYSQESGAFDDIEGLKNELEQLGPASDNDDDDDGWGDDDEDDDEGHDHGHHGHSHAGHHH
ncbi:hypothetical protein DL93DRAFT_1919234 [Clavulina sp. PMI_390]|nr:hypothetical protein DL93DRAFT_1919234 [Clavulina sp. PMI_390]